MKDQAILKKGGWVFFLDDKEVTQEEYEKRYPPPKKTGGPSSLIGWSKPVESDALSVHPSQVKEAMERDRAHGVPTEYTPDGRPIIRSYAHKRALMRSLGVHENNCFS